MNDADKYTILLVLPDVVPRDYTTRIKERFNVVTHDQLNADQAKYGKEILGVIMFPISADITREFLARMPNLRVFSLFCAGYDFLNFDIFRERGIRVFNLGGIQSDDIADLVLGMMLGLSRCIVEVNNEYKKGPQQYYLDNPWRVLGKQVKGSTLGIVGMGSIGYEVAVRARAIKMKILYNNRNKRCDADESAVGAVFIPKLHDMLPLVDVIVVCCPLSPATRNLFSSREFELMKPTAVFINVARGKIVDTDALVTALQNGSIGSAGLDVTYPEPLPDGHPLLNMRNVMLTAHTGSSTIDTRNKFVEVSIENILAGIEGRSTATEIDVCHDKGGTGNV